MAEVRDTVGVLKDKVVGGMGYSVEWSTDTLIPTEEWTDYYIHSPAFVIWGFDARLEMDINQPQKHCQNVSMVIRLSPLDPLFRPKGWTKMCQGTETFLRAKYDLNMTFDSRKVEGDIKILTTSPNVFQLNFELPLNKVTGTPQMTEHFLIKFMIEKPEKEHSLKVDKAILDNLLEIRHFSDELARLLANPERSDLTIRCGNQEFPVHKFILSARSTTLKKMFAELKEGILDLDIVNGRTIDPRVVQIVLEWIYTGVLKDKGDLLDDISALAGIWGLEKLEKYSNKLLDINYRLELPEIEEIELPLKKKSKTEEKNYNLVLGDHKVTPWKSRRMEWTVQLGEEVELHSPSVSFFGVNWSLLMNVHYNTNLKTFFQISLEPEHSAFQSLGFEVGAEPRLKFHIKYKDHEYCSHSDEYDYSDYIESIEDECVNCPDYRDQVRRIGINKYKFEMIVNRLYDKEHEIQIDWTLQIEFKCGVLADKMQRETNKEKVFLKGFAEDFGGLLDDPEEGDVVLRCEGKDFRAHKIILAAQSPVFKLMLETPMKESLESVIEVRDVHGELVDEDVVGAILHWMYAGELAELDDGQTLITLGLADLYNLSKLKELCGDKLKSMIKMENVVDILIMADFVGVVDLKLDAIQFILKDRSIAGRKEFRERVSSDLLKQIYMD